MWLSIFGEAEIFFTKNVKQVKVFKHTINEQNFKRAGKSLDSSYINNANFHTVDEIYLPGGY